MVSKRPGAEEVEVLCIDDMKEKITTGKGLCGLELQMLTSMLYYRNCSTDRTTAVCSLCYVRTCCNDGEKKKIYNERKCI